MIKKKYDDFLNVKTVENFDSFIEFKWENLCQCHGSLSENLLSHFESVWLCSDFLWVDFADVSACLGNGFQTETHCAIDLAKQTNMMLKYCGCKMHNAQPNRLVHATASNIANDKMMWLIRRGAVATLWFTVFGFAYSIIDRWNWKLRSFENEIDIKWEPNDFMECSF